MQYKKKKSVIDNSRYTLSHFQRTNRKCGYKEEITMFYDDVCTLGWRLTNLRYVIILISSVQSVIISRVKDNIYKFVHDQISYYM